MAREPPTGYLRERLGKRFSLAPMVRVFEFGHGRSSALHGLDALSESLGLDRERARQWALLRTLAWSFSSSYRKEDLGTVQWLHDAR